MFSDQFPCFFVEFDRTNLPCWCALVVLSNTEMMACHVRDAFGQGVQAALAAASTTAVVQSFRHLKAVSTTHSCTLVPCLQCLLLAGGMHNFHAC
jgi:hypothetical protein